MADEPNKPKKKRRTGGGRGLWILTAVLGVAYLAAWAAIRQPDAVPQRPASGQSTPSTELPEATKQSLIATAQTDANSRAPGSTVELIESKTESFAPGTDLRKVPAGIGQRGLVLTFGAVRNGKLTERLTYHALPPGQVVFISQEARP